MASTSRAIRLVLAASAAMAACAVPASASWRQRFLPPDGGAAAVAVDGAGDVVAAGGLSSGEAAVAKLDGTTGEAIWSRVFGGTGSSYDALVSVAVDAAGDAVVGGTLWSATTDLAVLKFAGTDGTELWRTVSALKFSVRLGSADPQCATFGGTVRRDHGAAAPGQTGYFLAAEAPAASGTCP